jgi:cytochrome P450
MRSSRQIPGPSGQWPFGCMREYTRDPLGLLLRAHREYGEIVRYRLGPVKVVQLNHPSLVKHVLVDGAANYRKARRINRLHPLMGDGLFLNEGDSWRTKRKLVQPAFQQTRHQEMIQVLYGVIAERLACWERLGEDESIELTSEFMALSLSFVGRALFSLDLGAIPGATALLDFLLDVSTARVFSPNPFAGLWPTAANRRFRRALRELEKIILSAVERRLNGPSRNDLLSLLMSHRRAGDEPASMNRRLRDELVTFCLAGRGTTATALSWMFYMMGQHPDIYERLRSEAECLSEDQLLAEEDLQKLPFSAMVFKEIMRLYPPIWVITREAIREDEINGYSISPGTVLFISPYVIHRHPEFWTEPDRFLPERFSAELPSAVRPAYLPFGSGPRTCIGLRMSMLEAQLTLLMVIRRFSFRLLSGAIAPEPRITLRPRGGVRVQLRRLDTVREACHV